MGVVAPREKKIDILIILINNMFYKVSDFSHIFIFSPYLITAYE